MRSGSSGTPFCVRELVVYKRLRDEHEDCQTNIETNTLQIGEHADFVTQQFDILHVQRWSLCVTMFILTPFNSSLKVTHNSLLNNIGRIKVCVTF